MAAAAPPAGIDPVPHIDWAYKVARMVARQYGFHRGSQESEDLESAAYLTLVKAAQTFDPGITRPDSTVVDAFRGCYRRSIVRDCRREALRIKGGGAELIGAGRSRVTLIRVGGLDDADALFPSLDIPTDSEELLVPNAAELLAQQPPPEHRPEIDSIVALDDKIRTTRIQIAEMEADANLLSEFKRLFAPLAALLNDNPAMKPVLISVVQPSLIVVKPSAPVTSAKPRRK